MTPRVFIVGAGPGDPGLLTVRGLSCLESADVVVHDHQIPRAILKRAREDAELIDVGHTLAAGGSQEAVSYLVAGKAREGKVVVRLKWGDPFVFDRGAEEALYLHEQGLRGGAWRSGGHCGPGLCRSPGDLPGGRRHGDPRARV